jgi:GH15 family glucan-1,4-alpha-glucosidase
LLDAGRGGHFVVAPTDLVESRQYYEGDGAVLTTELRGRSGTVRLVDLLTVRSGAQLSEDQPAGRRELLRVATVLDGRVRLRIEIAPRGGATVEAYGAGVRLRCRSRPDLALELLTSAPMTGTESIVEVGAGQRLAMLLRWGGGPRLREFDADALMRATSDAWARWTSDVVYDGPQATLVRRAAITLKLLDYLPNGGIIAAPTSSLPETLGGTRNWDYRYVWIRDAAFTVYALHRIGLRREAGRFLAWILDVVERHGSPRALYDLDGGIPGPEHHDPELEGYRHSSPVRWGNAAAEQPQNDVYGEILDCAYQWTQRDGALDEPLWRRLSAVAHGALRAWRAPDHGIWEIRTVGRLFTYSAAMCHVATDRAARLARRYRLNGGAAAWQTAADRIRDAILSEAWDPEQRALTQHLGGGGLDASLLALPLRRVIQADHPKMVATTEAVRGRLGAGGALLYRYLPEASPDGLPGREGAFLLASFWLVDNLAGQGRLSEAHDLYATLCGRANALGLLPEQIEPSTGAFLGNYPQALSHVGLISSGVNLVRWERQAQQRESRPDAPPR